ncbi:MAG: hypothetical protein ACLU37_03830 [Collinsella sp.]
MSEDGKAIGTIEIEGAPFRGPQAARSLTIATSKSTAAALSMRQGKPSARATPRSTPL